MNNWTYPYLYGAQPQPQQNNIIWVSGEAGAKAYAVAAGQSVVLMDSERDVFYIKTSDASGMPMPLRVFDFKERVAVAKNATTAGDYITREEFEKRLQEVLNGKQSVSADAKQQ